jgi:dTDP-4-dehydrorhamnose reductase
MKMLITGLNGTLAPKVALAAERRGYEVAGWDRARVPPDDAASAAAWLQRCSPDAVMHLAMGSEHWAAQLAAFAAQRCLPFIFTSTAMVFHHEPDGPHAPGDLRTAQDDYGRYKIRCEDAVRAANAHAVIARIGWQIDGDGRGNNMLAALHEWQAREGRVAASRAWRPACSFMEDTAAALLALVRAPEAGVLHLDSNAEEAHGFDRIVQALQQRFQPAGWCMAATEDYRHDQRLVAGPTQKVRLPPLSRRLPALQVAPARGASPLSG